MGKILIGLFHDLSMILKGVNFKYITKDLCKRFAHSVFTDVLTPGVYDPTCRDRLQDRLIEKSCILSLECNVEVTVRVRRYCISKQCTEFVLNRNFIRTFRKEENSLPWPEGEPQNRHGINSEGIISKLPPCVEIVDHLRNPYSKPGSLISQYLEE